MPRSQTPIYLATLRTLVAGTKKTSEIRDVLGVSQSVTAARLRHLLKSGHVSKHLETPARGRWPHKTATWTLTKQGQAALDSAA